MALDMLAGDSRFWDEMAWSLASSGGPRQRDKKKAQLARRLCSVERYFSLAAGLGLSLSSLCVRACVCVCVPCWRVSPASSRGGTHFIYPWHIENGLAGRAGRLEPRLAFQHVG